MNFVFSLVTSYVQLHTFGFFHDWAKVYLVLILVAHCINALFFAQVRAQVICCSTCTGKVSTGKVLVACLVTGDNLVATRTHHFVAPPPPKLLN